MTNFLRYQVIKGAIAKIKSISDYKYLDKQVQCFLDSDYFKELPILKIDYYLSAALARKVHGGQKNLDNIQTDIESIANYLPYCDAIFIDKECASLLDEKVLKSDLSYGTRVFSIRTKREFLQYLRSL